MLKRRTKTLLKASKDRASIDPRGKKGSSPWRELHADRLKRMRKKFGNKGARDKIRQIQTSHKLFAIKKRKKIERG